MSLGSNVCLGLARSSYYISLLGLKIPAGLLVRASRARHVLALISLVWVPFLCYCHAVLLPMVQSALVWHGLMGMWVTIPMMVVGNVILTRAFAPKTFAYFATAFSCMMLFHAFAVPVLARTTGGGVLLQALFAFFEDAPVAAWIYALVHVVRLQDHIKAKQNSEKSPFTAQKGSKDTTLIVGNAPTLMEGLPLGGVIDSFNQVVRFNQYSVHKPEFTGSRVTSHFCNGRNFPTSKVVQAICPLFNASLTHAVYLFMPHLEDTQDIYRNLTSTKVDAWFVEEDLILNLRKKLGSRIWQIPTSGMVAIESFLQTRKEVSLVGFNFFEGKKIHYFEESPTQLITSWLERFVTHDPSLEKIWVQSLAKEGRVSFLADTVAAAAEDPDGEAKESQFPSPDKEKGVHRRGPGLLHTLIKDGLPSQFSL